MSDFGTDGAVPVDYPDFVRPAARSIMEGRNDLGVVLGGSGNGEAMAASKSAASGAPYAGACRARALAKQHNDANMISIGARLVSESRAIGIVDAWLQAEFERGRHVRRIAKLEPGRQCLD